MTSPTASKLAVGDDFVVSSDGAITAGTGTGSEGSFTGGPVGGRPEPTAVLTTEPASRSAWITV